MGVEKVLAGKFENFAIDRYLDPLNRLELSNDLWSLLAEMDVMKESVGGSTVRKMFLVPGEGFYHEVGGEWVKYTQFFERAIESVESRKVKNRFEAERLGWERAESVLEDKKAEAVMLASPPGETYSFPGMDPLSATFVLLRGEEDKLMIDEKKVGGVVFDAFSLYVEEMSTEEHLQVVRGVGELTDQLEVISALSLVAMPFLLERTIEKLDQLMIGLGFGSWEEMEEKTMQLRGVMLQGGNEKNIRRNGIVEMLGDAVDLALSDSLEFEWGLVAEAIKRVLSKEAIGHYLNKDMEQIRQDVQLTIYQLHRDHGQVVSVGELVDPIIYLSWIDDQSGLMEDMMFQRMMSAHGGGGVMVGKDGQVMSMDMRANNLLNYENRNKSKEMVKCGCGEKIAREKVPCSCPKCHKKVSKGRD